VYFSFWRYTTPTEGWGRGELRGDQQSGNARKSGREIKDGRSTIVPKISAGEAQMRDIPEGGELDPAESVRKRYKKNSASVLTCINERTKEGCDRGRKSRQLIADEAGKGQLL